MKKLALVLALFAVAFSGCSSDSETPTDPVVDEKPIAEGTIGNAGGVVAGDGIIVEISAFALGGDVDIKIFEDDDADPFGDQTASGVMRIEGLPHDFLQSVTVKLAHGAAHVDSLYGLVGGETFVPSRDDLETTWTVADCRDSVGWAIFDLEPLGPTGAKANTSTPVLVTTIKGISYLETGDEHFRIYWSPRMATTAQITALRGNIEDSMLLYDLMGFEQTGFDAWPVKVLVKPLDWFGHWAPSGRALGGHLAFSTRYIDDEVEMPLTAGHELLHFCQYFYDPRTVYQRAYQANPNSWLDEATAVYIEDYFSADETYCSAARGGRELTALDGLINPYGRTLADHGYGQSSIIRYLAETEGDDFILKTYQDIATGTHAAAALQNQTETDLQDVWQDLLEDLVTGKIYSDVTYTTLKDYGVFYLQTINSPADSVGTGPLTYPDLSGQPWYIRWGNDGYFFNDNQRLEIWSDAPEYGLSVFGMKEPDTRELLSHAYGKVVVNNLPNIRDNYSGLMVLVSNHHFAGPDYNEFIPINLQSRLRESENFGRYDHARVRIQYEADWSTSPDNTYAQEMNFSEVWGTFTGTTFNASWDSTNSTGTQRFGFLTATLDPVTLQVTSWAAKNAALGADGSTSNFEASGGAIPDVKHYPTYLDAIVEGEESCASINSLSVTFVDAEGTVTRNLDGWSCNPSSYVKVLLNNRDPD